MIAHFHPCNKRKPYTLPFPAASCIHCRGAPFLPTKHICILPRHRVSSTQPPILYSRKPCGKPFRPRPKGKQNKRFPTFHTLLCTACGNVDNPVGARQNALFSASFGPESAANFTPRKGTESRNQGAENGIYQNRPLCALDKPLFSTCIWKTAPLFHSLSKPSKPSRTRG